MRWRGCFHPEPETLLAPCRHGLRRWRVGAFANPIPGTAPVPCLRSIPCVEETGSAPDTPILRGRLRRRGLPPPARLVPPATSRKALRPSQRRNGHSMDPLPPMARSCAGRSGLHTQIIELANLFVLTIPDSLHTDAGVRARVDTRFTCRSLSLPHCNAIRCRGSVESLFCVHDLALDPRKLETETRRADADGLSRHGRTGARRG